MVDTEQQQPTYVFGVFELDIRRGELRKHGVRIKLQQQPVEILRLLLERPAELVSREDIQKRLWPDDTYLAFDNAINSSIRKIREALGDTAENPRFIETLSRRGYRFIAPVAKRPLPELAPVDGISDPHVNPVEPFRRRWWRIAVAIAGFCAIAAILWWRFPRTRENSGTAGELLTATPFTSYPGYEVLPAFSPDGSRVAFSWQKPGTSHPEVYIKLIGTGEPLRVSAAGGFGAAWSPDGRFLAYLRPIDLVHSVVVITPALAGQEREVARVYGYFGGISRYGWAAPAPLITWSPDGNWLLTLDSGAGTVAQPLAMVRLSIDTGEKRPVPLRPEVLGEGGLALSMDGKRLAFTEDSGFWARDIYVAPVSGDLSFTGKPERLTFDHKAIAGLAWTSDSKHLIFSSPRSGKLQLWKIGAERGSAPIRLGLTDDEVTDIAVSHEGNRLIFAHEIDDQNIWRASVEDHHVGKASNLIASTRRDTQARYSPDGARIAFESNRSGNEEIWVCNADGSNPVQLTYFGNAWAGAPSWSPDGKQIAFAANAAGEWDIYIIGSDGGRPRRFTHEGADESWPTWSRDGQWIYYFSNRSKQGQLWKMRVSGGPEVQVTSNGALWSNESLDGKDLYYSNGEGLWKQPVSGGREVRIARPGALVPAKDGLYFTDEEAEAAERYFSLSFFDFKTQQRRIAGRLPGPLGFTIEISPDSRWFLYSKFDQQGSELMMVDNFR